jgi:hypothetical protein
MNKEGIETSLLYIWSSVGNDALMTKQDWVSGLLDIPVNVKSIL